MIDAKAVLLDIEGVLHVGGVPVPGGAAAVEALQEVGIPFRCVSNTTRRSRASLAAMLRDIGYEIPEKFIFTPSLAAAREIEQRGGGRCFLLATGDVHTDFLSAGIPLGAKDARFVVVGDAGDEFTYESMNRALRLLLRGADLIALEKDRYWRGAEDLMLSAGPYVAALEYAAGNMAHLVGKPSKAFFTLALDDMGVAPEDAVMIGDDIATDIGGAKNAGMKAFLVRTGKYREELVQKAKVAPDEIIDSVAALAEVVRLR
ncbi:TIGR01458 family HAD-type hydrolase [Methanofollis aquaemaris]|uniref:Haloacid dehalogenase-like hydrolase domain-containing protein 2 n=1 Tax=Methanofollis aquaemaris TaxID=126734 RepID=A0A8A3S4D2_9EURY|nr:TIGR01458 family HAD-type hydrolase [Methanofollis aquaemaris]QSZ66474.1 TIGR01458 family HAD-type hydrolase [Methanofollis aquaemaris]